MDAMAKLGRKFTCYSCHTKFYDLGKTDPLCPKCGADPRDAEDMPVMTSHRRSKAAPAPAPVVVEPIEEDFVEESVEASDVVEPEEEGEIIGEIEPQEPEEEDDDEEEEF